MAEKGSKHAFMFLIYPEDFPDWKDRLKDTQFTYWVSPLHDKDIKADGTLKVPHYHVILYRKNAILPDKAREWFSENLCFAKISPFDKDFVVENLRGCGRYHAHLDDPDKYQYDYSLETVIGSDVNFFEICLSCKSDKYIMIGEMIRFIRVNQVVSYSEFMDFAEANRIEWFKALCDFASYTIREYIKSLRFDLKNQSE